METKITQIRLQEIPENKQNNTTHNILVNVENFDKQKQKLLVQVNNKVYETKNGMLAVSLPKEASNVTPNFVGASLLDIKAAVFDKNQNDTVLAWKAAFDVNPQTGQYMSYSPLSKATPYMTGDITAFKEQDITTTYSEYEPWKDFDVYNQYIGYFCYGINSKSGGNPERNAFLTGFTAAVRYEAYNINDKNEYSLHNWMYLLNVWMDNRGEMADAKMNLFNYKCNVQSGINREIQKNKLGKGKKPAVNQSTWNSVSKGKQLHDEIFLQKKLILLDNIREMDFGADSSLKNFYNRIGALLREASIFNRTSDISYSFALANKDDDNLLATIAGKSAAHDYPFLTEIIKNKSFGVFKEIQGIFDYVFDDVFGAKSFIEKMMNYRGPFQLDPITVERNNAGNIYSFTDDKPDAILYDLQLLNKTTLKP